MAIDKSFWFVIKDQQLGEIKKYPWLRRVKDQGYKTSFWIHSSNDEVGKRMTNAIAVENIEDLIKEVFLNKHYVWLNTDESKNKQGLFVLNGDSFISWGAEPKYEALIKSYLVILPKNPMMPVH